MSGHTDPDSPVRSLEGIPLDRGVLGRIETDRQLEELRGEVETLRRALESRTSIALATGMLAERHRCSSSAAWDLISRVSSHTNIKVREVARLVVALADGTTTESDAELVARLAAHLPHLDGPSEEQ